LENPFLYKNKKIELRVYIVIFTYKKNNNLIYKIYLYNKFNFNIITNNFNINNIDNINNLIFNVSTYNYLNINKKKIYFNNIIDDQTYIKLYN